MASGECVVTVEPSIISPSSTGIQSQDYMICLMNCMGPLYFPRLIFKVDITKFELKKAISGKPLLRPNLDYMNG